MSKKKLFEKISAFLEERSVSDGGYAPVKNDDVHALAEITRALLELKYETDTDREVPISFEFTDKTRFQRAWFSKLPHLQSDDENRYDMKTIQTALRAATANLELATSQLKEVQRVMQTAVFDEIEQGHGVRSGARVYQQATRFTTNNGASEAASEWVGKWLDKHRPTLEELEDFFTKIKWNEKASEAASKQMGFAVEVSFFSGSKSGWSAMVSVPHLSEPGAPQRISLEWLDAEEKPSSYPKPGR